MAKIVDKEAKRKKILLAALRVIAEKGLVNTRMSDIAKAADVGKGTLYEYFRSKEEVMHEGFLLIFGEINSVYAQALPAATDPVEKIRAMLNGFSKAMSAFPSDFMQVMFDVWAEAVRSASGKQSNLVDMKQFYTEYRGLLTSILSEGIEQGRFRQDLNPSLVASCMLGSVDGLMLQWVMDHTAFDFDQALQTLFDSYMQGLLSNS